MADETNASVSRENSSITSDDENLKQADVNGCLGNIIVVENLPVVPKENIKFEMLKKIVETIFGQIGVIKDGLWMPLDPFTQETLGFCFIEYNTPQEAELAREKLNLFKLDKSHIFATHMFAEWAPPETKTYTPTGVKQMHDKFKLLALMRHP